MKPENDDFQKDNFSSRGPPFSGSLLSFQGVNKRFYSLVYTVVILYSTARKTLKTNQEALKQKKQTLRIVL